MIGRYDIRWHNEKSHILGSLVMDATEEQALVTAVARFQVPSVFTVVIWQGSKRLFEFRRNPK